MKWIGSLINRKPKHPDCSYDEAESLLPSRTRLRRDDAGGSDAEFLFERLPKGAGEMNAEQLRQPSRQMPPPTNDKNLVVTDFC